MVVHHGGVQYHHDASSIICRIVFASEVGRQKSAPRVTSSESSRAGKPRPIVQVVDATADHGDQGSQFVMTSPLYCEDWQKLHLALGPKFEEQRRVAREEKDDRHTDDMLRPASGSALRGRPPSEGGPNLQAA